MDEFKIIKIQKKDNMSKKNLYKQILSSSKKVKDIINGKKFDYLNNVVINKKLVSLNQDTDYEQELEKEKQQELLEKQNQLKQQLLLEEIQKEKERKQKLLLEEIQKEKEIKQQLLLEKIQKEKERKYKEEKEREKEKKKLRQKTPKNVTFNIPKKKSFKSNNDCNKNKKSKKKNKLLEIIKLLNKNKNYESRTYSILKKLNKDFIVDILLALNLIKKRSNAPKQMLDNILFSYITSNIIITYK